MGGKNSRRPTPPHKLRRAATLLSQGVSLRKVAKLVNLDRKTIRKYLRSKAQVASKSQVRRCPGCGMLVKMPCLRCEIANEAGNPKR